MAAVLRRWRAGSLTLHQPRSLGAKLVLILTVVGIVGALGITALLRKRTATHLPREVREELLLLSRASRESLRAPVRFLRFQHRMMELAKGGEPLPTAQTELRLEDRAAGAIRLRTNDGRRAAARGNGRGSDPEDQA